MKNLILLIILPVILCIIPGRLFAQTNLKLSGSVSDSSKPLTFATIRLFKINNTKPLQTVLTNEQGHFEFNKPDTGMYVLSFTHTGYAEKKVNVTVTTGTENIQVDQVLFQTAVNR